jgi:hypothetical protein
MVKWRLSLPDGGTNIHLEDAAGDRDHDLGDTVTHSVLRQVNDAGFGAREPQGGQKESIEKVNADLIRCR